MGAIEKVVSKKKRRAGVNENTILPKLLCGSLAWVVCLLTVALVIRYQNTLGDNSCHPVHLLVFAVP
eukprot:206669-Amphidinium_carterae.1